MTTAPEDPQAQPTNLSATDDDVGVRFDAFLAQRLPQYSRVRLRQVITAAAARVNDVCRKAAYRMRSGDQVTIQVPQIQPEVAQPEDIPLDILYEDDHLVAINKPHGMVVHPSRGHWQGTLTAALTFHFQNLSHVGGTSRPGIVHRLDRDTSGAIVVAKDDQTHLNLAKQFELRTVEKEYFAICHGSVDRDRDVITAPIGIHPFQREKMAIREGHSTSREASTFYEVQERVGRFTSLRVFPKTGRTHQIRVHLCHLGYPVVCDLLYTGYRCITQGQVASGSPGGPILLNRMALHAHRLQLDHPYTGERLEIVAPIPQELKAFLESVGRGTG